MCIDKYLETQIVRNTMHVGTVANSLRFSVYDPPFCRCPRKFELFLRIAHIFLYFNFHSVYLVRVLRAWCVHMRSISARATFEKVAALGPPQRHVEATIDVRFLFSTVSQDVYVCLCCL